MSHPKWLNKHFTTRPEVTQIFDDLDAYRQFCVDFGRVFNEADLYNERSRNYEDFLKFKEKGYAKNHWFWNPNRENKPHHHGNRNHHNNGHRPNVNYRSR